MNVNVNANARKTKAGFLIIVLVHVGGGGSDRGGSSKFYTWSNYTVPHFFLQSYWFIYSLTEKKTRLCRG